MNSARGQCHHCWHWQGNWIQLLNCKFADVRQFLSLNQKILLWAKPRHLRFPFRYLQFDGCMVHLGNCRNALSTPPFEEDYLQLQHTMDFYISQICVGTLRNLGFKAPIVAVDSNLDSSSSASLKAPTPSLSITCAREWQQLGEYYPPC